MKPDFNDASFNFAMEKFFNEISKQFTPEFSGEDWVNLTKRAEEGDTTSRDMLLNLWMKKVDPHILPEFKLENQEVD